MNRRAKTWAPIKDNRIFGVCVITNGRPRKTLNFYYRRRFRTGEVYTGPYKH